MVEVAALKSSIALCVGGAIHFEVAVLIDVCTTQKVRHPPVNILLADFFIVQTIKALIASLQSILVIVVSRT